MILSTVPSRAQDADEEGAESAAMADCAEMIAPGPEHALMQTLVGKWTTRQTLWMAPGAPAMEIDGSASFRMVLGGRYLLQSYKSEITGMGEFEGRGTTAFDKATGEYINTRLSRWGGADWRWPLTRRGTGKKAATHRTRQRQIRELRAC